METLLVLVESKSGEGTRLRGKMPECAHLVGALAIPLFVIALSPRPAAPLQSSPAVQDVQLQLSTSKSLYRQGELIPMQLSFTSSVPKRYQVNEATYDRSGRMWYEQFQIEPSSGASDPLRAYFGSLGGIFLGGLTEIDFLSETPYVLRLNLNEWVRFDKPGNYQISVSSRRVTDTLLAQGSDRTLQGLRSNTVDLQIIEPEQAWQQAQLKTILSDFAASPPPTEISSSPQRLDAVTALRYLGSADAARELARHLRGDESQVDWNCMLGLVGSPNRPAGYEEMKKLLVDPDFPVDETFLNTIAMLPLNPADSAEILRQERDANWKEARSALMEAISIKRGKAQSVSAETLLQNPDPGMSEKDRGLLVSLLREHFGELRIEEQRDWLEGKWSVIKGSEWLPTVRAIATEFSDYPVPDAPNVLPTYDYFKLSGDGLMRWYELDPVGARPAVIAEIVRQRPRFSANTLGILPDKVLPDEERAIADHFLTANGDAVEGNLASLLNRYADAAVLAEILPKIAGNLGPWSCIPESNEVAYVNRVDPEAAKPLMKRVSPECQQFHLSSNLP